MSGIAGVVRLDGGAVTAEQLQAMLAPMRRRGPDLLQPGRGSVPVPDELHQDLAAVELDGIRHRDARGEEPVEGRPLRARHP